MTAWELPTALNVGGVDYHIRTHFGAILDILAAHNDPLLDDDERVEVMLTILYPDFKKIPREHLAEAVKKACEFIDCGQKREGTNRPRLVDWNFDAPIIIPAINNVAGCEIRALPSLHWWTFWGYFMSIGESLLSSVIHIRRKKAKREKLDKWEERFYKENKSLIDFPSADSDVIQEEKAALNRFLEGI